jgi:flagellin-like hook-associated protein FlgL
MLSLSLLAIFAISILTVIPVSASVAGSVEINQPDIVVPGGGIELDISGFSATGGSIYFYLSDNDDPEITSGDVRMDKIARDDVLDEISMDGLITLYCPDNIQADEYYAKITDSSTSGADCIVSSERVEVITEDLPVITADPTNDEIWEGGSSGTETTVEGSEIDLDYDWYELYWREYEQPSLWSDSVVDGEFTAEDVPIPEVLTTMGVHKILVKLYDGETIGTFVEFEIVPSLELITPDMVSDFSVEADEVAQIVDLIPHGFPEGTIDEDSIDFIVKDFETGSTLETIPSSHGETDVNENGTIDVMSIYCEDVDWPPVGSIDVRIQVDDEVVSLTDQFLSSEVDDPGKFEAKMDKTSVTVGSSVTFSAIMLPAYVTMDIILDGDSFYSLLDMGVSLPTSDGNGAWKKKVKLEDMTAGEYTVRIKDETNGRTLSIGTLELKVKLTYRDLAWDKVKSIKVGEDLYIEGEGFPLGAEFRTIEVGSGEVDLGYYEPVDGVGDWESGWFEVPKTSGGGQSQDVVIEGKDEDGRSISIEGSIKVKPDWVDLYMLDYDEDAEWYTDRSLFGGTPMQFLGSGFLADEEVEVELIDPDTLETETMAEITDEGTADDEGELEVVFNIPTTREFGREDDWQIKIAGSTSDNSITIKGSDVMHVESPENEDARLYFNLEDDFDLDLKVKVGDTARIVGVGFDEDEVSLQIVGGGLSAPLELDDYDVDYGYFDVSITIPQLVGDDDYTIEDSVTGVESTEWIVQPRITFSPTQAGAAASVTVMGDGWAEEETVDFMWPDLPKLTDEDTDEDGVFEKAFTVPTVTPGTYTMSFEADSGVVEEEFVVLGALKIASLGLPGEVYNGSTVVMTVNVQDFFGTAVTGASVTGSLTPPGGSAMPLSFTEAMAGFYESSYTVPVDATEGTYVVRVTATKAEAGGEASSSGTFLVSLKTAPMPPANLDELVSIVNQLSSTVSSLQSSVSSLSSNTASLQSSVSSMQSSVADLQTAVNAAAKQTDVTALQDAVDDLDKAVNNAANTVGGLNTMMLLAVIMAAIAAVGAILSIFLVYRKIA